MEKSGDRRGTVTVISPRAARFWLWVLVCVPVVAALMALYPWPRHPADVLNALGRLTGIGGLSLFLVAAVISFRFPGFDRHFGGLLTLWRIHHRMGCAAFLLLLAHPLLLALAQVPVSLESAVAVLFPREDGLPLWFGWWALLLTMVFMAPVLIVANPDYQRWKLVHRLSGLAALLALGHTFLLERTLPAPWSTFIWSSLSLLAVGALCYSLVLRRRTSEYPYRVAEVQRPANNVVELVLENEGKPLRYQPGQFVYLKHFDRNLASGYGEEHPYTLSSAPEEPRLRLAIKDLGNASRDIQEIAPGVHVRVTGPYGAFFPETSDAPELWIAGGIGITPFLSRARHLAATGEAVDILLIFGVQDEARALYREEWYRLAKEIPGFRFHFHYFYINGVLDEAFIREHCPDCAERHVYVCGPRPLLKVARNVVTSLGVPGSRFHSEEFNLL